MTPAQGTTTAAHKTSRKTTRAKADVSAKTAATAAPQKAATSTVKQTRPLGHVTFVGSRPR